MTDENRLWAAALERTPACLDAERFAAGLSTSEVAHVAECPRCQAERSLWNSFEQPQARPEDGAAVQWVTAELRRRSASQRSLRWSQRVSGAFYGWRTAAAALCTIVVAVGITLSMRQGQTVRPVVNLDAPVYRSAAVALIAPVGDQGTPPIALEWQPQLQARQYRVHLMEVDHTILWTATVSGSSVRLPPSARAAALPGKTLLWQVQALGPSGEVVGSSTIERFRLKTKQIPDGE